MGAREGALEGQENARQFATGCHLLDGLLGFAGIGGDREPDGPRPVRRPGGRIVGRRPLLGLDDDAHHRPFHPQFLQGRLDRPLELAGAGAPCLPERDPGLPQRDDDSFTTLLEHHLRVAATEVPHLPLQRREALREGVGLHAMATGKLTQQGQTVLGFGERAGIGIDAIPRMPAFAPQVLELDRRAAQPLGDLGEHALVRGPGLLEPAREARADLAKGPVALTQLPRRLREDGVELGARPKDLHPSLQLGLFTSLRIFGREALSSWPTDADQGFEDLRDWRAPDLQTGRHPIRAEAAPPEDLGGEPSGTPAEYLRANFAFDPRFALARTPSLAEGTRVSPGLVIGRGATVPTDTTLERVVVWEDERVPGGLHASDGVFADGRFFPASAGASQGVDPA